MLADKIGQLTQFFKEVRIETKKVTFPSRKDTLVTTYVVIALVIIISIYLGIVDFALSKLFGLALK
ncbi:MAG: preprotein translocase subunit SecE [Nitrospinae bacterium]|nr:preprotein translocase subunit SecE [Nitrospinota bacterium]